MDRTRAILHLAHSEMMLLRYADDVRRLRTDLDALDGWGDHEAAAKRARVILGYGADFRDDADLWIPQTRAGRALLRAARLLLRVARAIG